MTDDTTNPIDESRRSFLGSCGTALQVAALGGVLAPLLASCGAPRVAARDAGSGRIAVGVESLAADRTWLIVDRKGPDGRDIIVVREAADRYVAMSMRCTHKGCEVAPPSDEVMICPCHGARFDLGGAVVNPPATEPLRRYATTFDAPSASVVITLG